VFGIPGREQRIEAAAEEALRLIEDLNPELLSEIRSKTECLDRVRDLLEVVRRL
jgi:hypothetical protein